MSLLSDPNVSSEQELTLDDLHIRNIKLNEGEIVKKNDTLTLLAELQGQYLRIPADEVLGKEYIDMIAGFQDTIDNLLQEVTNKNSKQILLRVMDRMIQWKYESDSEWTDLFDLSLIRGESGKSAYELAVEYGFTGTEEEFAEMFLQTTISSDKVTYYDTPLTTIINRLMYKSGLEIITEIGKEYGDNSPVEITWESGATFSSQMVTYSVYTTKYNSVLQESVQVQPDARSYTIDLEDIDSPVKIVFTVSGIVSVSNKKLESTVELFYGYRLYYLGCKESEIDSSDPTEIVNNLINHPDTKSILITDFNYQEIEVDASELYDYIFIAAPNMYGKLGCQINNWIDIFPVVSDGDQVENRYGKYATYTTYRSAHNHLGRVRINLVSV